MTDIRETMANAEANSKLLRNVSRSTAHRPRPGDNLPSQNVGYSGDTIIRKSRDGSVRHGVKHGNEWYYRKYTKSGEDEWDITNLIGVERIQSMIFKSNLYSGKGWQIAKNDKDDYTLEIDNIIVRKAMTIWELIINKLRASNGTFIVGSSAKVLDEDYAVTKTGSYTYDIIFEADNELANTQPFVVGDVIACKRFWLREEYPQAGTEQIVAQVTKTDSRNHAKITVIIQTEHSYGEIKGGMDFVRVASSVASRQGLVVLSSDGNDNIEDGTVVVPFIDVYGGLETYDNFLSALGGDSDFIKVRMGRLDQLTGGTDEYGIWASVVHLIGSAVEGVVDFHYGTRAEFNALTSTETDTYHDGDVYIITDEKNNIYTWYPDGVDVVGLPLTPFNNAQVFLTMGIEYTIKTYVAGDDFTGVGSANNNEGTIFRATGRYPTTTYEGDDWVASTLTQYWVDKTNESILGYQDSILRMLEPHWLDATKNKITILEKAQAFDVFQEITDSHTDFILEASTWGVSSTAYVNAYNALDTYLNTTITWEDGKDDAGNPDGNWTTEVDGSLWTSKWQTLFAEIADLKSDISIQIDAQVYTDANGRLYKAPTTGTAGLFLGSTHLGYHNGAGVWNWYGDNTGQLYCVGALGTALWWKPADTALYIGGLSAGDAYIKAIAGSANIEWYGGNPSLKFMTMGANINGTGWYGIDLGEKAFIYKYNDNNNAVSTLHSELYNQTTNYIGGISSLVSTTSGSISFPTNNLMCGIKAMGYSSSSSYYVAGVYGIGKGALTAGRAHGGYFVGKEGQYSYGIWAHADDAYQTAYGIYVKANAEDADAYGIYINNVTSTVAGEAIGIYIGNLSGADGRMGIYSSNSSIATGSSYFWAGIDGDETTAGYGIYFGASKDTNLYRSGANALKTDDAFQCASLYSVGNITTDGTVDGVDVLAHKALTDNVIGHGFSADIASARTCTTSGTTILWSAPDWESSFGASDCFPSLYGTFYARYAGIYQIDTVLSFNGIPASVTNIKIEIVTSTKTVAFWIDADEFNSIPVSGYVSRSFSMKTKLAVGQTAYVKVTPTGASVITLTGNNTHFSAYIIGIDS